MKKKEVVKASNIIHIAHTLSLIQQRLWNILLAEAFDRLDSVSVHQIPLARIRTYLGTTRNTTYIKKQILALNAIATYTVINKARVTHTGSFALQEGIWIENGICYYTYSKDILELIRKPPMFAKIALCIQKKLRSKYSLFLYELCLDYSGIGQTPQLSIPALRKYLGLDSTQYKNFKQLNYCIIKPALAEITKKTDLTVQARYYRTGTTIVGIKFLIITKCSSKTIVPIKRIQKPTRAYTRKQQQLTNQQLEIQVNALLGEHFAHIDSIANNRYQQLTNIQKEELEQKFKQWLSDQPINSTLLGIVPLYKKLFHRQTLLTEQEQDFILWAAQHGYTIEKEKNHYRIITIHTTKP